MLYILGWIIAGILWLSTGIWTWFVFSFRGFVIGPRHYMWLFLLFWTPLFVFIGPVFFLLSILIPSITSNIPNMVHRVWNWLDAQEDARRRYTSKNRR